MTSEVCERHMSALSLLLLSTWRECYALTRGTTMRGGRSATNLSRQQISRYGEFKIMADELANPRFLLLSKRLR